MNPFVPPAGVVLSGATFHHIGVISSDIEKETAQLAVLGYVAEGPDFTDPIQGVHGRFLTGPGPRLELLSPVGQGGVLSPWMKSGVKMYHLAYMVPGMDEALEQLRQNRGRIMVKPVAAVAFGGRQIAFIMLPNMLLVEVISAV
ncbi:MAG: VOC family protein [Akkermansiaceae bacterium]|nr:VOC family protein [Verrucomicrobiales bacterium]